MKSGTGVLVDECLSPQLAQWLTEQGCQNAVSVRDLDMSGAEDEELLELARQNDRILLTLDWKRVRTFRASDSLGVVCLRLRERERANVSRQFLSAFMASGHIEKCKHKVLRLSEGRFNVTDCAGNSTRFSFGFFT